MSKHRLTTPARMAALFGAFAAAASQAAPTDLANSPLANGVSSATLIRPNLAFVVDDSGSMDDQNMPDSDGTNKLNSCWGYFAYNTLAYNPAVTYKPPYDPNGTLYSDGLKRYPDAVFSAALRDGYFPKGGYTYSGGSTSNSKADLSDANNLPNRTFYYSYPSNSVNIGKTACLANSSYTTVTDSKNIAAPNTTAGSAQALTNYANWYSYYRRRAFTMKAATAEAFSEISDKYRVGLFFLTSQESGANTLGPNNDLAIDDFTGTQRTTFFSRLLGNRSSGWTPLRGALARMGRMYAGKLAGWDPVQYSCQQNFTILSTDGYWNTPDETSTYGPYGIDGTTKVGNTDAPPVAAVPASAKIKISAGFKPCYYASSITVNTGTTTVELLSQPAPAANKCANTEDGLGNAVATGINNNGASTGFAASYNSGTDELTITAPASAGNLSVSPVATFVNVSGGTRTFTTTPFGGYKAAVPGANVPYQDALNKANTLADIAYYYYVNDLRTPALGNCSNTIGTTTYTGLCENNVFGSGKDTNSQQHMTTFTIGLGANGTIKYESNYETAKEDSDKTTIQYYDILNNNVPWPDPTIKEGPERIDDLWHAAVNGRGTYYSASNAEMLAAGIKSALAGLAARTGSSSAAATSNLEPVAGDNFVFAAKYWTMAWYGDIEATTIDPQTGAINSSLTWNGQKTLDAQVAGAGANADGRTIKYFSTTGTGNLQDFSFTNLTKDGKGGYFSGFCTKTPTPDQCGTDPGDLTAAQVKLADDGENLVRFLRGQGTYENELIGTAPNQVQNPNPLYRGRDHVLGDIVNAVPVYLKKPPFTYDRYDTTYEAYIKANETRAATVFVAANDGMLHAFNADTGSERWAFVPSFVMSNMWKLADAAYGNNHQYFVDGSPTIADVCSSSTASGCGATKDWKSILVGGLNKGGCGYYALDVTDPANPKGLWEFTHENLGYSYGNPIVTRRKDGKWVVIFASGYNNIPGNGCNSSTANSDGNGHVFVLDALTGQLLEDIQTYTSGSTPAGTATTPSGLAKLNAWLENGDLNIATRLYGGDLLGNLWRIDFDDNLNPNGKEAMRLAQLTTAAGVPQPITTKVELNTVKSLGSVYNVVLVGTGKYLGSGDPGDTSQNTLYALKDKLQTNGISNTRGADMVQRTLATNTTVSGEIIRTISGAKMDWATKDGWYFDFNPGDESPGERVNNDMQLFFNKLTVPTNVPDSNVCNVGGYAYVYYIDINTGLNLAAATNSMAGLRLTGNALIAGIKTVRLANGKTVTIVTDTGGNIRTLSDPGSSGNTKLWRTTWREIAD
ncbi:MAG: pilus assembly protein [Betaproteobacteria bacterium]